MENRRINRLTTDERRTLLKLARDSVVAAATGSSLPHADLGDYTPTLREKGACFVTLYAGDRLRGCTGILVAQSPLVQEVIRTAAQTALSDPRFRPVTPREVPGLSIEISVLTPPQPLAFSQPEDLPRLLRPGVDGVTLSRGMYRATFLPQVWDRVPDPVQFLDMLCEKMGLFAGAWRQPGMQVDTYQVEEFSENELAEAR
jgi:AmmeMemoRadiSam system protein A